MRCLSNADLRPVASGYGGNGDLAVDGDLNSPYVADQIGESFPSPWLVVDLREPTDVRSVVARWHHRIKFRPLKYEVRALDVADGVTWRTVATAKPSDAESGSKKGATTKCDFFPYGSAQDEAQSRDCTTNARMWARWLQIYMPGDGIPVEKTRTGVLWELEVCVANDVNAFLLPPPPAAACEANAVAATSSSNPADDGSGVVGETGDDPWISGEIDPGDETYHWLSVDYGVTRPLNTVVVEWDSDPFYQPPRTTCR